MEYRRFFSPRNIYYGAGALESLATVSCQRALVTTDRAIRALGMVERVERILQANGAVTRIFDQVEAEPSKETAWQAFYLAQEFGPDLSSVSAAGESTQSGNALLRAVTSPQAQQQSQTLIDRLQLIGADPTENPGNAPLVDGTNLVHQCV